MELKTQSDMIHQQSQEGGLTALSMVLGMVIGMTKNIIEMQVMLTWDGAIETFVYGLIGGLASGIGFIIIKWMRGLTKDAVKFVSKKFR